MLGDIPSTGHCHHHNKHRGYSRRLTHFGKASSAITEHTSDSTAIVAIIVGMVVVACKGENSLITPSARIDSKQSK